MGYFLEQRDSLILSLALITYSDKLDVNNIDNIVFSLY